MKNTPINKIIKINKNNKFPLYCLLILYIPAYFFRANNKALPGLLLGLLIAFVFLWPWPSIPDCWLFFHWFWRGNILFWRTHIWIVWGWFHAYEVIRICFGRGWLICISTMLMTLKFMKYNDDVLFNFLKSFRLSDLMLGVLGLYLIPRWKPLARRSSLKMSETNIWSSPSQLL